MRQDRRAAVMVYLGDRIMQTRGPTPIKIDPGTGIRPEAGTCHSMAGIGRKFNQETSLHGLKYLTEPRRHWFERIYWVLAVLAGWVCAGTLIFLLLQKWQESPVLVTFHSIPVQITEIPFPSFTVCNMNKIQKKRADEVNEAYADDHDNATVALEHAFIQEICELHDDSDEGDSKDINITGEELHHLLHEFGHDCNNMLLKCSYHNVDYNCSDLFIPTITDVGECCSFNMMPEAVIFKNDQVDIPVDEEEEKYWQYWSMQDGYEHPHYGHEAYHTPDMISPDQEKPLRGVAPGLHMGLSVLLNVESEQYYCSGSESVGFKALLHTPITVPELVEFGFGIEPGTETFFTVTPEMIHADEAIHKFSYHRRQCYLDGEKELMYYRHYSYLNCFIECAANYTKKKCGCVAFYMPRHQNDTPICAPNKAECVHHAVITVEESASDDSGNSPTDCQCLPGCTEISFQYESSTSKLSKSSLIKFPKGVQDENADLSDDEFIGNNLALFHIYFKALHFMRRERGELYTVVDFLSNIGGVLGLCMGFSALSLIEIIYFFTIRLFFNKRMGRVEEGV